MGDLFTFKHAQDDPEAADDDNLQISSLIDPNVKADETEGP